jgi:hypothetical protein
VAMTEAIAGGGRVKVAAAVRLRWWRVATRHSIGADETVDCEEEVAKPRLGCGGVGGVGALGGGGLRNIRPQPEGGQWQLP